MQMDKKEAEKFANSLDIAQNYSAEDEELEQISEAINNLRTIFEGFMSEMDTILTSLEKAI